MHYTKDEYRLFFLFIVAAIAAPILILSGYSDVRAARKMQQWPTTQGKVNEVLVETFETEGRSREIRHRAHIAYEYTVDGQLYSSSRIAAEEESFSDKADAIESAEKLDPYVVTVYYDPQSPKYALLRPGLTKGPWTRVALGFAALIVAVLMGRHYLTALRNTTMRAPDGGF